MKYLLQLHLFLRCITLRCTWSRWIVIGLGYGQLSSRTWPCFYRSDSGRRRAWVLAGWCQPCRRTQPKRISTGTIDPRPWPRTSSPLSPVQKWCDARKRKKRGCGTMLKTLLQQLRRTLLDFLSLMVPHFVVKGNPRRRRKKMRSCEKADQRRTSKIIEFTKMGKISKTDKTNWILPAHLLCTKHSSLTFVDSWSIRVCSAMNRTYKQLRCISKGQSTCENVGSAMTGIPPLLPPWIPWPELMPLSSISSVISSVSVECDITKGPWMRQLLPKVVDENSSLLVEVFGGRWFVVEWWLKPSKQGSPLVVDA